MRRLIKLKEAITDSRNKIYAFDVVAVVVGLEEPKATNYNGNEAMVMSLSLGDGTTDMGVTINLWSNFCIRGSTLKAMDIVHFHDIVLKEEKKKKKAHEIESICLNFKGGDATFQYISDGAAMCDGGKNGDAIVKMSLEVKSWRDSEFKVVCGMRDAGRVWYYDDVRHGEQKSRAAGDLVVGEGKGIVDFMRGGKMGACAEIQRVYVDKIYLKMDGKRRQILSEDQDAHTNNKTNSEIMKQWCWHGCETCHESQSASPELNNKQCTKCMGDVGWRFGDMVVWLRDDSGSVAASVKECDVQWLFFGLHATDIASSATSASWAADVVAALVSDNDACFTAVVMKRGSSQEQVWLHRLLL